MWKINLLTAVSTNTVFAEKLARNTQKASKEPSILNLFNFLINVDVLYGAVGYCYNENLVTNPHMEFGDHCYCSKFYLNYRRHEHQISSDLIFNFKKSLTFCWDLFFLFILWT